jgi:hypothetical protein
VRAVAVVICLAAAASSGCTDHFCNTEADSSSRYRADILDRYDEQSRYKFSGMSVADPSSTGTCAGMDGIQDGAAIELQATSESIDHVRGCRYIVADVVGVPQPTVLNGPSSNTIRENGNEFMYAVEEVTVGSCTGTLLIEVFGGTDIYASPVEGQSPHVILYRAFFPGGVGTCKTCDDNFVVQFSRL